MQNKVVLVGESNPYGSDPYYALYPSPYGSAGWRLCCLILRMFRKDYLESFERVNLCGERWSVRAARAAAQGLEVPGGRYVLCGAKVCAGFGQEFKPFTRVRPIPGEVEYLILPHPSGLCRLWTREAFVEARTRMAEFAPEVAHLLGRADLKGN